MCLYVDMNLHKGTRRGVYAREAGFAPCRVAQRDILVYKVLDGRYTSPYQYSIWVPGVAKTATKMRKTSGSMNEIEAGLHALTTMNDAEGFRKSCWGGGNKIFPAVIPKGSRVFFGRNGHIAADKMVIFKDVADLEAKYGKIGAGVPKADIAK